MTDATFFGVEDEEDTSAAVSEPVFFGSSDEEDTSVSVSEPVFFGSSDEEDTSAVGDSPETVAFDEDTPPEDLPTPGEDGKPLPRQQGESPVPLVSKDEARAKGEMGITEAARNDYAAATGADAPDNPVLAQVANMGLSVGGRLNANLQMKAAQRLMSDEELSDGEMDSAFDAMQFGVAAPFAAAGRAIAGGFRSRHRGRLPVASVRHPARVGRDGGAAHRRPRRTRPGATRLRRADRVRLRQGADGGEAERADGKRGA